MEKNTSYVSTLACQNHGIQRWTKLEESQFLDLEALGQLSDFIQEIMLLSQKHCLPQAKREREAGE